MGLMRRVPLKLRRPLYNGVVARLAKLRARHWPLARPGIDTPIPGPLVVSGFVRETSGIGQAGRLTADALEAAGPPAIRHDLTECYRGAFKGDLRFPGDEPGGVWLIHANAQEALLALLSFSPDQWANRYRIAYWAWETSRAPALWIWAARFFHEIWVPSGFVADLLVKGFQTAHQPELADRIRVMPHPITAPPGVTADRARFGLEPDAFEMLCLFDVRSTAMRKNPWATIDAWTRAFPAPRSGLRLCLKAQRLHEDPVAKERVDTLLAERPDIRLFDQPLDDLGILSFIASFDALISLHRSEGFGMTLAEAMLFGVTAIGTGWSGNLEFMDEANSFPVPYRIVPVRDPSGLYGSPLGLVDRRECWAEPDIDAAAAILRAVVDNPERTARRARATARIESLSRPWSPVALAGTPLDAWLREPIRDQVQA